MNSMDEDMEEIDLGSPTLNALQEEPPSKQSSSKRVRRAMVTQSMMYLSSSSSIRLRASNLEKSWREDEWEVGGGEEEEEEEEGGGKRGEEMGGVAPMLEGKGWGKDSERTVWRGRPLSIDQSRGQWGRSSRRGEEIQENNSNNNSYDGDSPNIREAEERFLDLLAGCATPSVNRKSTKIKTLYNEIPFVVSINEEEEEEEEGEGDLFGEGGEGGKMVGMEKKVGMNSPLLLPFTPGLSQQRRGVVKKKKLHFSPLTRKEEGKGEALGMVEGRVSGEKEWKEGGEGGERGEDLGGKGGEVVVEKGEEGKEGEKRGEGMGGEQEIEEEVEEEGEKKDDTPEYMKLAKEQELILSVLKYEDGDIYVGQTKNDEPHGWGTQSWEEDGSFIRGKWEEGELQGVGEREWGDKSNYLGEFENSELNGVGVMVRRGEDGGEEGEVYRGEWKDDKPHGHGILEDGKVRYEGGWKEGKFEGWGVQKDEHGMFMGGFVGGMKQGEGVAVFGDGTIYVGAFWEDDFEGVGKFFSKGGSYHGEFKKNKRQGHGIQEYSDGSFAGQFDNNTISGFGILNYSDGSHYSGQWKDDTSMGHGTRFWPDKNVKYQGMFSNDTFEGYGTFSDQDTSNYEGEFSSDVPDGYGVLTLLDGTYHGEFKNGMFDGYGVRVWKDGRNYSGLWKQGKMHGFGVYSIEGEGFGGEKGKDIYVGGFVRGLPEGSGCWCWSDGSYYVGELKGMKRSGFGRHVVVADGSSFEGEWKDDRFYGLGCRIWGDGSTLEGEFRADCVHGPGVSVSVTDEMTYSGLFSRGKKSGEGVGFWATGARYAGEWLDNVPHGLGVWLSPDRKTKKSGKWAYGRYEENTKDEKGVGGVGRKAKKKAKKAMVTAQSAQISGCYARAKILLFRYGLLKDGGWLRGDNSLSGVAIAKKKVVPGSMMFLLEVERGVEWESFQDHYPVQRHVVSDLLEAGKDWRRRKIQWKKHQERLELLQQQQQQQQSPKSQESGVKREKQGALKEFEKSELFKTIFGSGGGWVGEEKNQNAPKKKKIQRRNLGYFEEKKKEEKEEKEEEKFQKFKVGEKLGLAIWFFIGPPCTGKVKCAKLISKCLSLPLLDGEGDEGEREEVGEGEEEEVVVDKEEPNFKKVGSTSKGVHRYGSVFLKPSQKGQIEKKDDVKKGWNERKEEERKKKEKEQKKKEKETEEEKEEENDGLLGGELGIEVKQEWGEKQKGLGGGWQWGRGGTSAAVRSRKREGSGRLGVRSRTGKKDVFEVSVRKEMNGIVLLTEVCDFLRKHPDGVLIFRGIDRGSPDLLNRLSQALQDNSSNPLSTSPTPLSSSDNSTNHSIMRPLNKKRTSSRPPSCPPPNALSPLSFTRLQTLYIEERERKERKKREGEKGYNSTLHLLHSCAAGDLMMCRFLIEHTSVDVTEPLYGAKDMFEEGATALQVAKKFHNFEIVNYLENYLKERRKEMGASSFPERCHRLLWKEVSATGPSYSSNHHLLECCLNGDFGMVRFLVEEVGGSCSYQGRVRVGGKGKGKGEGEGEEGWEEVSCLEAAERGGNEKVVGYIRHGVGVEREEKKKGRKKGRAKNERGSIVNPDVLYGFTSSGVGDSVAKDLHDTSLSSPRKGDSGETDRKKDQQEKQEKQEKDSSKPNSLPPNAFQLPQPTQKEKEKLPSSFSSPSYICSSSSSPSPSSSSSLSLSPSPPSSSSPVVKPSFSEGFLGDALAEVANENNDSFGASLNLGELAKGAVFIFLSNSAASYTLSQWVSLMTQPEKIAPTASTPSPTPSPTPFPLTTPPPPPSPNDEIFTSLKGQVRRCVDAVVREDELLNIEPSLAHLFYSSNPHRSPLVKQRHVFPFFPFSLPEFVCLWEEHLILKQKFFFKSSRERDGLSLLVMEPTLPTDLALFYMQKMLEDSLTPSSTSSPFSFSSTPTDNLPNSPDLHSLSPSLSPTSSSSPTSPDHPPLIFHPPKDFNQLRCFHHFDKALTILLESENLDRYVCGLGAVLVVGFQGGESKLVVSGHESRYSSKQLGNFTSMPTRVSFASITLE